ncbi:lipoprotein [Caballeronia mineralivorans PML1(12)]|uniref:Lipoprotein n=1 Tax=Caballeronia mineralivorans PML1(12) TaxID=908627 RepID=A0A0J1D2T4_9BURK|nr:lipoprotein [Caballeronia mineralivorans PML1(12)]
MKRLAILATLALLLGSALGGCIIVPDGGGYHHHDYYGRY